MSTDLRVRRANPDEIDACRQIRLLVFVEEQGVPGELEWDEHEDTAIHLVAIAGGRPVGTARLRVVGGDVKAERVAVLPPFREHGVGRALMRSIERETAALGLSRVVLNAQERAIPFYERIGYHAEGPRFDEAGIPHRRMVRGLDGTAAPAPAPDRAPRV